MGHSRVRSWPLCVPTQPWLRGGDPLLPGPGLRAGCCSLPLLPACLCPTACPRWDGAACQPHVTAWGQQRRAAARPKTGHIPGLCPDIWRGERPSRQADPRSWQWHCRGRAVSPASTGSCQALPAAPAAWPGSWSMLFSVPCPLCRRCALGAVEFPDRLKTSHLKHNRLFLWMLLLFCSALQKQLNRGGQL